MNIYTDAGIETRRYLKRSTAAPFEAWSGPDVSKNLKLPDFVKTAQDGGNVVSLTHRPPLPPGNTPGTHFCFRLNRPPEP